MRFSRFLGQRRRQLSQSQSVLQLARLYFVAIYLPASGCVADRFYFQLLPLYFNLHSLSCSNVRKCRFVAPLVSSLSFNSFTVSLQSVASSDREIKNRNSPTILVFGEIVSFCNIRARARANQSVSVHAM